MPRKSEVQRFREWIAGQIKQNGRCIVESQRLKQGREIHEVTTEEAETFKQCYTSDDNEPFWKIRNKLFAGKKYWFISRALTLIHFEGARAQLVHSENYRQENIGRHGRSAIRLAIPMQLSDDKPKKWQPYPEEIACIVFGEVEKIENDAMSIINQKGFYAFVNDEVEYNHTKGIYYPDGQIIVKQVNKTLSNLKGSPIREDGTIDEKELDKRMLTVGKGLARSDAVSNNTLLIPDYKGAGTGHAIEAKDMGDFNKTPERIFAGAVFPAIFEDERRHGKKYFYDYRYYECEGQLFKCFIRESERGKPKCEGEILRILNKEPYKNVSVTPCTEKKFLGKHDYALRSENGEIVHLYQDEKNRQEIKSEICWRVYTL